MYRLICCVLLFSLHHAGASSATDTLDIYDTIALTVAKTFFSIFDKVHHSEPVKITDPEAYMTAPEIIKHYGYPVEIHKVTTKDGFVLELHRILSGRNDSETKFRPPVLVMHGMATSSAQWLLNTPKNSMGFILADEGYDVWLGNFRANSYSKHHTRLSSRSREYWNFSWQEIGFLDLPSTIEYILNLTEQKDLAYVSHSMGGTSMAVLLSTHPEYNSKISKFISISPAMFVGLHSYIKYLAAYNNILKVVANTLHIYRVCPRGFIELMMSPKKGYRYHLDYAYAVTEMVTGFDKSDINITRFGMFLHHVPEPISMKILEHFAQLHNTNKFQTFDEGDNKPPVEFNLSKITVPTWLIWSPNDQVITEQAVKHLEAKLPNLKQSIRTKNKAYSHIDPYMAIDSREVIIDEVVKILKTQ